MKRLTYAGIGSRKTPDAILSTITYLSQALSDRGWLLRSGHARGADTAFEHGARNKKIFLPWSGFNNAITCPIQGYRVIKPTELMEDIARKHHPNWGACLRDARLLHMRNVCQVLGEDCKTPADMVVCWTPNGSGSGGTGQAIRIAASHNIPVFDLAISEDWDALQNFVEKLETTPPPLSEGVA